MPKAPHKTTKPVFSEASTSYVQESDSYQEVIIKAPQQVPQVCMYYTLKVQR